MRAVDYDKRSEMGGCNFSGIDSLGIFANAIVLCVRCGGRRANWGSVDPFSNRDTIRDHFGETKTNLRRLGWNLCDYLCFRDLLVWATL